MKTIRALILAFVVALSASAAVYASGFTGSVSAGSGMIAVAANNHVIYSNGASWTSRTLSDGIDAELTYFGDSSVAQVGDMLWRDSGRWSLIRGQAHNPGGVQHGYFLKNDNGTPTWADASTVFQGGSLGSGLTWASSLGSITHIEGPSDQSLKFRGDSATGTNAIGRDMSVGGGLGTGTGQPGDFKITTGFPTSSGSTVHTEATRYYAASKTYAHTDNVALTLFNVAIPSGEMRALTLFFSGRVWTATPNYSVYTGAVGISAYNKAGTVSTTISAFNLGALATDLGTFAPTVTAVANGNSMDVKLTLDTNLGSPTGIESNWTVLGHSPGLVVVPQ